MVERLITVFAFTRVFQRVTHRFSLLRILTLVTSALVIASCASTTEWKGVEDKEARLLFDGSEIDIEVALRKQRIRNNVLMEDILLKRKSGSVLGEGELLYEGIERDGFYFDDSGPTLPERITGWYPDNTRIEFYPATKEENHMGPYEQHRFKLHDAYDCAAFGQYLGPVSIDPLQGGREAKGTISIVGFYCAGAGMDLSGEKLKAIFNAIDVPSRPKEEARPY